MAQLRVPPVPSFWGPGMRFPPSPQSAPGLSIFVSYERANARCPTLDPAFGSRVGYHKYQPALAFLAVIPAGNLLLVFALAFLAVIPAGNLLLPHSCTARTPEGAVAFRPLNTAPKMKRASAPGFSATAGAPGPSLLGTGDESSPLSPIRPRFIYLRFVSAGCPTSRF